jgi:hypothetical protein
MTTRSGALADRRDRATGKRDATISTTRSPGSSRGRGRGGGSTNDRASPNHVLRFPGDISDIGDVSGSIWRWWRKGWWRAKGSEGISRITRWGSEEASARCRSGSNTRWCSG